MQGWRIHMEDAHVAETKMYAAELDGGTDSDANNGDGSPKTYTHIDLPGHSIFAVFDGHGGTFAAMYSGRNLCRVLSRQPKFVQYAKFMQERAEKEKLLTKSRERVQYITTGLEYIEGALRDTFVELDQEIASALQGSKIADADTPYHKESPGNAAGAGGENAMECSEAGGQSEADSTLQLLEKEGDSGTTANVVIIAPQWVVCSNAGDSRSVFSKNGNKAVPLSYDHKPDDEEEERRIRAAGGYVAGGRVEGDLAVSRGLGDFRFKNMQTVLTGLKSKKDATGQKDQNMVEPDDQKVSPVPDVIIQNRSADKDEFIIVACDGIWDVQSNYEGVKSVAELFDEGESDLGLICEEFCDQCLSIGSKDNMTAIVVKFEGQKIGNGGGVSARRAQRNSSDFPPDNSAQQQQS